MALVKGKRNLQLTEEQSRKTFRGETKGSQRKLYPLPLAALPEDSVSARGAGRPTSHGGPLAGLKAKAWSKVLK